MSDDSWRPVRDSCAFFGVDPARLIEFAEREHVTPSEVEKRFTATLIFMAKWGLRETRVASIEELDARPPGRIDPRLALQGVLWVDLLRRRFQIEELTAPEARVAVGLVGDSRDEFAAFFDLPTRSAASWLATTPLMMALNAREAHRDSGHV